MSCKFTQDDYSSSILQKLYDKNPIFRRIEILSGQYNASDIGTDNISSFSESKRFSDCSSETFDGGFYLEAYPSYQADEYKNNYSSLEVGDFLAIDGKKNSLTIQLTHDLYQKVPLLKNSEYVTVKKLASTKKGHGAQYQVSYSHCIKIEPYKSISDSERAKVQFILNKIFHTVELKHVSSEETDFNVVSNAVVTSLLEVPADFAEQLLLSDPIESYEYLNLLLLNSSQLSGTIDEYISAYQSPVNNNTPTETLMKTSFVHGSFFSSNLLKSFENIDWKVISLLTASQQILLLRNADKVYTWFVQN